MIGGLIAIAVAVWFFNTAQKIPDKDPVQWGAIGVAVYYVVVALWRFVTDIGFMADLHHQNVAIGMIIHYMGPALGVLAAWLVRRRWLSPAAAPEKSGSA